MQNHPHSHSDLTELRFFGSKRGDETRVRCGRRDGAVVVNVRHAEDSTNPDCRRTGDGGAAAAASRRFLHSLECTQLGRLQAALLREQNLLRCLEKKHTASRTAALQRR